MPLSETIDTTPLHLKTAAGANKARLAIEAVDSVNTTVANAAKIFYDACCGCCDMDDFKEIMSDQGTDLGELLKDRGDCIEQLLLAVTGRGKVGEL